MNKFNMDQNTNLINNFVLPLKLNHISFETNQKNQLTTKIQEAVSNSFNEYFQQCSNHDEYRPKTGECLSQFGFSATVFESLEVLYILDLKKEFQKAKNFIMKTFSLNQAEWINRREFWSRCIGSLLSTYILTSDSFFLMKAIEYSNSILQISITAPYVNVESKKYRNLEWIEGTSLTDIVAGLPELFTLSKLTNNESYSLKYLTILNNIPTFSNNSIFNFYNLETKKPIFDFSSFGNNIIDFFHILSIAYSIKPMKSLKEILSNFLNYIQMDENQYCVYSRYSSLFDTISIIDKNNIKIQNFENFSNFLNVVNYFLENQKDFFESNCSYNYYLPFRFDASLLRAFIRSSNEPSEKVESKVLNFIKDSFDVCHSRNGFSGLLKINSNDVMSNNIQHSSFFGQWTSIASFLLSNQKNIVKNAVFNERGHLLYSPQIFPNEEDE